jgi:hypothetical protein
VKAVSDEHEFSILYLPPYTCEFNPIETVWGLLKRQWERHLITNGGREMKEDDICNALVTILEDVHKDTYINISRSHFSAMVSSIRKGQMV